MNMHDDIEIRAAKIKSALHASYAAVAGYAFNASDAIASSAQQVLSFLPQVQPYLKAEWIQGVTAIVAFASIAKMVIEQGRAKGMQRANEALKAAEDGVESKDALK